MKKKLFIVALGCILLFAGCSKIQGKLQDKNAPEQVSEPEIVANAVQVTPTSYQGISSYKNFGGDVQPVTSMDILSETSGKVSTLDAKVGDYVKKGQVLAQIDPSKPGMNYNLSPVKAPMSGTITAVVPSVGSMVSPAMSMGKIISTDDLEIVFSVVERYISLVKIGNKAKITFDAYPGEVFPATICELSPTLDSATRTLKVYCKLDKADARIISGMYAKIQLIIEAKEKVLVIPYSAIVNGYVFVVDKGTEPMIVHQVNIKQGIKEGTLVEIESGLNEGDEVVTKGQSQLSEGTTINIVGGTN
ncbi:MAG: efflux RND transporter periplasmic adaptor subunit [Sphaerochaetaceae bacterium]